MIVFFSSCVRLVVLETGFDGGRRSDDTQYQLHRSVLLMLMWKCVNFPKSHKYYIKSKIFYYLLNTVFYGFRL